MDEKPIFWAINYSINKLVYSMENKIYFVKLPDNLLINGDINLKYKLPFLHRVWNVKKLQFVPRNRVCDQQIFYQRIDFIKSFSRLWSNLVQISWPVQKMSFRIYGSKINTKSPKLRKAVLLKIKCPWLLNVENCSILFFE
jgi:hypothetical protein